MVCVSVRVLAVFLLFAAGTTPTATGLPEKPDERVSEPDLAAQEAAEKKIKEILKVEYAAKLEDEKRTLIEKLLKLGGEEKKEEALRYVCLREARDLAARSGDFATALGAVEEMSKSFAFDTIEVKAAVLETSRRSLRSAQAHETAAAAYFDLIGQAVAAGNFDLAVTLATGLSTIAVKSRSPVLAASAPVKLKEVRDLKSAYDRLEKDRETLARNPGDPAANLALGKFLCLLQDDWVKGLPMLAKAREAAVNTIARKEAAIPKEAAEQVDLGDRWWQLAAGEAGLFKVRAQRRAAHWYAQASDQLSGVERARVEKLLAEYDAAANAQHVVYLSELTEENVFIGHGRPLGKKGDMGYLPLNDPKLKRIVVNTKESPNGLSLHPPHRGVAYVTYKLDGKYRSFQGEAGIVDGDGKAATTPIVFRVLGDDKVLWTSPRTSLPGKTHRCSVRVTGVTTLRLEIDCPGDSSRAHAVWVEPILVRE